MRAARAEVRAEMLEARRSGGLAGSEEAPDAAQALQEELERVKREARAEAEAMRPALFSEALENIKAQVQAQAGDGEEAEGVDEGSGDLSQGVSMLSGKAKSPRRGKKAKAKRRS